MKRLVARHSQDGGLGVGQSVTRLMAVWVLLYLLAATSAMAAPQLQPIRAVKLIEQDEAGLPIRFPASLAYDPLADEIYITSPLKNKLVVLTADYFPYLSIGSGRGLHSISGSFLKDGKLYVCVGGTDADPDPHIAVYDGAFMPQQKIYLRELEGFSPLAVAVGATGNIYVVGFNGTGVVVLDPQGNYLRTIEPKDEVLGVKEKATILALDVGRDGRLYFVSEAMGRVYVYDQNERFLLKFGEKGGEPGKLSRPRGIAIDDFRRQVYIVDYQRHTVSVYAMSGEYLFEIGGMGQGRGWFYYPNDIIVDGQGRLLIADTFNHRIQVFEFVGGPPQVFGAPGELVAGVSPSGEALPEPERVRIAHLDIDLPADAKGDFLVLTAISGERAQAESLAAELRGKGYQVHLQELDKGVRGTWTQVLVGPYEDPLEAQQVAEQLRSELQLPAILKTRGAARELLIAPPASAVPLSGAGELTSEQVVEVPLPPQPPQGAPLPLPEVTAVAAPAAAQLLAEAPAPVAAPQASNRGQAEPVTAAPPRPQAAGKPPRREPKVDFCVRCHDQRVAKVCLQCHPRERAARR